MYIVVFLPIFGRYHLVLLFVEVGKLYMLILRLPCERNSPPDGLKGWFVWSARLGVSLLETPLPWHTTIWILPHSLNVELCWAYHGPQIYGQISKGKLDTPLAWFAKTD